MRLFIAVDLGEEVRTRVTEELSRLRRVAPEARWVTASGFHATLVFLGYIDDSRVPAIEGIVRNVAGRHRSLTLTVEGIGAFGASSHPRVLWIGLGGETPALGEIKADLERELLPLGYQPEKRDFKPHLTLARARQPSGDKALARCLKECKTTAFGAARINRLILFRSDLSPKGARYTALAEPLLLPPEPGSFPIAVR